MMTGLLERRYFLWFATLVAFGVGGVALIAPNAFLATKGIVGNPAAGVWMREVGAALVSISVMTWSLRNAPDSPAMLGFLRGGALLQGLLLSIEIWAYAQGLIPVLMSIVPNSVLHVVLGLGFLMHARAVTSAPQGAAKN